MIKISKKLLKKVVLSVVVALLALISVANVVSAQGDYRDGGPYNSCAAGYFLTPDQDCVLSLKDVCIDRGQKYEKNTNTCYGSEKEKIKEDICFCGSNRSNSCCGQ